ncbi:type VI secretion system lipoprotein TssJ [Cronobacter sakazakii]|nr:type VI secretion system lipoprotein TssJ [Cronobacter sakazakii]
MNFYRFCQWLERSHPGLPVTGSDWQLRHEPVRFRPHPGMGFPAGEIRGAETSEHPHLPPTVRITFMGLYGIEAPLPTQYIDDIAQRREGYEATCDFLDIFNHRLIAQYYRIWRKYSYPATFQSGGVDIYQLKDRKAFDSTDYPSLFADDSQAIKADLVAEKDIQLRPGESFSLDMPLEETAQYVAVAGMFMAPDVTNDSWRLVLSRDDLEPDTPRIIEASNNRLTLQPVNDK